MLTHAYTFLFGPFSRYRFEAVWSDRLHEPHFFVTDVEHVDDVTGRPAVVRQGSTLRELGVETLEDGEHALAWARDLSLRHRPPEAELRPEMWSRAHR